MQMAFHLYMKTFSIRIFKRERPVFVICVPEMGGGGALVCDQ